MEIRELLETALQTYLAAETSATVYTGTDDATKALPCLIVAAGDYKEEYVGSALYRCTVRIMVRSAVDDLTDHNTLCDSVRTALRVTGDELATALDSATLRIYGWGAPDEHESTAEDDAYTDTFTVEIMASPL
jgi:hypothetical protein